MDRRDRDGEAPHERTTNQARDGRNQTMAYEVKLDVFTGPIDLLLHLITRQRVDIYEISLATITEDFLAALAQQDLDLESATGFLVVAATLLELKSARLLPSHRGDEDESQLLEERDRLLARLVECATFRDAGAWIASGLERGALYHGRSVGLEERYVGLAPDLLARVTTTSLASAAAVALAPKPELQLDTSHVAPIRVSVGDAIVDISGRLSGRRPTSFDLLCAGAGERIEIVVRFLALLELYKAGAIELSQDDRFGAITARWTGAVSAQEVVVDAEEYSIDPGAGITEATS